MRLLQDWSTDQPGWWPSLSAAPAPLLDGVWGVRAGTCLGPRGPSLSSVPKNFEVEADDLVTISELGRGAYGVVEKVRHAQSGTIMAVKVSSPRPPSPGGPPASHLTAALAPQRIRATVNSQEQKRLLMDLDVNMRTVDCFYTVTFYGALFREVGSAGAGKGGGRGWEGQVCEGGPLSRPDGVQGRRGLGTETRNPHWAPRVQGWRKGSPAWPCALCSGGVPRLAGCPGPRGGSPIG